MTPDDPEIDHFETFDLLASMVTLVQADGHVLRVNGALENTLAVSRLLRCRNTAVARALSTSQQRWTLDTPFISDTIPLAEGVLGTVEELIAQVGQPVVGISGSLRPAERFPALHGWLDADVPPAWYCCAGAQRSYRGD
jgi:hypothetical protein